jgi:hypothetical protein
MPEIMSFSQASFLFCNALLAGLFYFVDEPMHFKRGLSNWEKASHLTDAFCNLLTFGVGYLACLHRTSFWFWAYCASAALTILVSFKDESVHKEQCSAAESMVHAAMFSLVGASSGLGAIMILAKVSPWPFALGWAFALFTILWQIGFWFFWRKNE